MVNFVFPEEITLFIDSIRPFSVKEVGSSKWLEVHEMIIKLSQQAAIEAAEHREEDVKEFLISHDKLKVLIHEAYCIQLWKVRVLPRLLEVDPNPHATFLIYTVLFHEGIVISLLDTALFHISGCEMLKDSALDLIDYGAQAVSQVIGLVSMGYHENESNIDVDEAVLSEIERQKRDLIYKIGLRSISILAYMAENVEGLSISAARRMVVTHDLPWLMVDLLCFRPWQRRLKKGIQKFMDDKWVYVSGDDITKVVKSEAQTWFCLRQLLFNPKIKEAYPLNADRCRHLTKALGFLHDTVLDQLPPLIDLKQYLSHITISGQDARSGVDKSKLLLEEVANIREQLIIQSERDGGFIAIAQFQEEIFLNDNEDKILETAKRLSDAYNTDLLAEFEGQLADLERKEREEREQEKASAEAVNKICGKCSNVAEKKCANCKAVYYCSRECQLGDWAEHKKTCIKV